ncbi:MAG: hypothetical protein GY866_40980 [Proteobacteria bacterium]|nr:hypothetical protein [Pseudomonadota bacterium]
MIILGITDIHGDNSKIEKIYPEIAAADLILLVGDLTNFGRGEEIREVLELVRCQNQRILAVVGNCDFPEADKTLTAEEVNIHGDCRIIAGKGFIGLGGSLATPSNATPNEVSEEYLDRHLNQALAELPGNIPFVLVSHQPPFQTSADRIFNGLHVGSKSVRRFIEQYQPLACFTGHIHEGDGIDSIGETRIINPGPLFHGQYAYAEINREVANLEIRKI